MVEFTQEDRNVLDSYTKTIKVLAKLFGSNCELVLHSLENLEECVIAIENGHISGRSVGAPITNFALEMVHKSNNKETILPYYGKGVDDTTLKCITTPIYNCDKLIGLMCVNFNIDMKISEFVEVFSKDSISSIGKDSTEVFSLSVEEMMFDLLQKVEQSVLQDNSIPYQDKNKAIIYTLDERGFFRLRGSTELLADHLKISPHTIYANLRKK